MLWRAISLTIVKQDGTKVLQCRADTDNQYDLNVQLSRDLAWDANKRSWRWHKTWRVPDCLVTADVNALHGIADLEAHLSVVCQAELPHHLEDAGVQSLDRTHQTATLQLVDGRCRFSRLRLVATTSTFGGRMFHFVVSIVKREGDSVTALASVISTAFAVYSRKNADKKRKAIDREAMIAGRWSEGYSFVPFEPKELDRTFIKKTTNAEGVLVEEEITNSWEGLLAYFQAPNIRFKIRHPLFLAIRFSNVLVILRDAFRFPQESEEALRSFICSCGFPLNCKRDPAVKIGHGEFLPPWLIAFRSSAMKNCNPATVQKLADLMKVVKGPALGFVPDDSLLPQRYSPTFDVASLGQLYTKLYALEFAGGCNGEGGENDEQGSLNTMGSDVATKRAKTKLEPKHLEGLVGFHPCGTPIFHPEEEEASGTNGFKPADADVQSSTGTSHGPSQLMRSSFESYFIALHGELRMLLQKVVELVSQCVTRQDSVDVESLRRVYEDFTEALSVHAYVEEHVLFKKLSDRVPNLTESYTVDHVIEKGRIDEISNIMKDMDPKKITDLFLKVSELAAVHKIHMDKEEYHLLPYFLQKFDDSEISELIRQCQTTINQLSQKPDRTVGVGATKISLLNPRHQRAIERALQAAGVDVDSDSAADPPDNINEHQYFMENSAVSGGDTKGDEVQYAHSGEKDELRVSNGDDVIALIEEMYS